MTTAGVPALGTQIDLRVQGRTGNAAVILGARVPDVVLCGSCTWRVDGLALPDPLVLMVPRDPVFLGAQIAAQGVDVNAGVCSFVPADLRFTEGVTITIR